MRMKDRSFFIRLIRMILLFEPMLKSFLVFLNLLIKCQKVFFPIFAIRKTFLAFKQLSILHIIWMNRRFFTIKKTNGKFQTLAKNNKKPPILFNPWVPVI